jgi:thioredoxin-related protein
MLEIGDEFKFNKRSFTNVVINKTKDYKNEEIIHYIPKYMLNKCFIVLPNFVNDGTIKFIKTNESIKKL